MVFDSIRSRSNWLQPRSRNTTRGLVYRRQGCPKEPVHTSNKQTQVGWADGHGGTPRKTFNCSCSSALAHTNIPTHQLRAPRTAAITVAAIIITSFGGMLHCDLRFTTVDSSKARSNERQELTFPQSVCRSSIRLPLMITQISSLIYSC